MTLLAFDRASVRYGERIALAEFSLDVAAGEIVGLIGESGSGKSSAALAAMGLLPAGATRDGGIAIDGRDMAALPERDADAMRGGTVGMIFQEPMRALNPLMTIGAQVAEALTLHRGLDRRAARAEAAVLLEGMGLDPARVPPGRYPHELSGGQRQRVGIAIAVAGEPRLLIADEPTTALDVRTQAQIMVLLVALVRERGMGLLLISHDLALVGDVADRIAVMKDGRLVEHGTAANVLGRPQHIYTRHLLARARHLPVRTAGGGDAPPLLQVRNLQRVYRARGLPFGGRRETRALDGVSLELRPGESLGVIGESGSGKTTLLRTVLGLDRPNAGSVTIDGTAIDHARGAQLRAVRRRMQAVFQDPAGSLDPRQRVEAIVAEPLHLLDTRPSPSERRRRLIGALERVGLSESDAARFPAEFSGGQRQRIGIARALILEPQLVVLDEAVSALDVSIRADILDLLVSLQRDLCLAYLFVSHDLAVMRATTDRLIVIKDGKIVEQGDTRALLADPQHDYTRALIAATPDLNAVIAQRTAQA